MISMIIPSYNRVKELQKCLESVISQFYDGLEVIVIDDFSTDSTRDYLTELAIKHSFIKIHLNDCNRGVNYSRNRGIEMVTKPFIMFLDSDDELVEDALVNVVKTWKANPGTKHFLFNIEDRENEFKEVRKLKYIQYVDWLRGAIAGDFTHVVSTPVIKKYLFFEQFRMYEYLNWLRIKRETSPQLHVPITTTRCERGRTDSLTSSSKLQSVPVIKSKFESERMYYSMYHDDLKLYSPSKLDLPLIKTILLGAACNQKRDSRSLIHFATKKYIKLLSNLVLLVPPSLLKYSIIKFSTSKRK